MESSDVGRGTFRTRVHWRCELARGRCGWGVEDISRVALIRRNGIRRLRKARGGWPVGIFAMPVTRNFYISHQWLRELKRRGQGAIAGVYLPPHTSRTDREARRLQS